MHTNLDPRREWLGVVNPQADAYELLQLAPFESSVDRIAQATETRIGQVATHTSGPHGRLAEALIAELRATCAVLSDAEKKSSYDRNLKEWMAGRATNAPVIAPQPAAAQSTRPRQQPTQAVRQPVPRVAAMPAVQVPLQSAAGTTTGPSEPLPVAELAAEPAAATSTPVHVATEKRLRSTLPYWLVGAVAALALLGLPSVLWWALFRSPQADNSLELAQQQLQMQINQSTARAEPAPVRVDERPTPIESPSVDSVIEAPVETPIASPTEPVVAPTTPLPAASPTTPAASNPATGPGILVKPEPAATEPEPKNSIATALSAIPQALKLPSLLDEGPQPLTKWAATNDQIELDILGEFARLPEGRVLRVQAVKPGERWRVNAVSGSDENPVPPIKVADLGYIDSALKIVWNSAAPTEVAQQLQNCHLRIARGKEYRDVQLREPVQDGRFVLSLQDKVDVRLLDIGAPPAFDTIHLEVSDPQGFSQTSRFKDDVRVAKLGKDVILELTQYPGASIHFRVDRKGRDRAAIYVSPIYKPNAAVKFDLSVDRLKQMRSGTQKALVSGQRDLAKRQSDLAALQSQYRSVNGQSARNIGQQQAKQAALVELSQKIRSRSRSIAALQKTLPEMAARLKALPEAEKLVSDLHDKATFQVRVFCANDDREATLYHAN
ncbi:MAG: hypothetical protein QGG36_26350 [Pirellulaceae bacterium]|nr:hypothetical protein [Pirellulaceae bacterium]MDP7019346.1 hypothetical protein [Pirellulaceae bacterium]